LRYVNAGHAAPLLVRQDGERIERLCEGGPVLGLLPHAPYSAGIVKIDNGDKLIVYSDGIIEAVNKDEEEFGEARIAQIVSDCPDAAPEILCEQIVKQVSVFASSEAPRDDRTLIVVKLSQSEAAVSDRKSGDKRVAAVA
jgi:phosphoserine phosphatase RsbU/P